MEDKRETSKTMDIKSEKTQMSSPSEDLARPKSNFELSIKASRRRSRSNERRRSRSRERRRSSREKRSRSRDKRSHSRERRRRSRDRDNTRPNTSNRHSRTEMRRDSPAKDHKADVNSGRKKPVEHYDARNYIDESRFKLLLESIDWKTVYRIVPTFDDYRRFRMIMCEMSVEYLNPFRGLYGRDPSLEDYVVFIERRQSRNWIEICGKNPSFEDYVIFSGHKGLPSWEGVLKIFGREPYFQEFMQYAALRLTKNWEAMGLRVPSFEDFMCYMIEIQSIDWNTLLGKVPGFTDYVVYLDKMSSQEWQSLATGVPDFLSYMSFKEGLPPPGERRLVEQSFYKFTNDLEIKLCELFPYSF